MAHGLHDGYALFVGVLEVGEVAAERVAQFHFARFHEFHHGQRGGDHLGDGGEVVEGAHGDGGRQAVVGLVAEGFAEEDASVLHGQHLAAGIGAFGYAVVDDAVDAALGDEAEGFDDGIAAQAVGEVGHMPFVGLQVGAAVVVFGAQHAAAAHVDQTLQLFVVLGGGADGVDGHGHIGG